MNKRPGRVLIVDDCPTDRAVMSHRLPSNGYQVMEAESGATALRLMMSDRFDLVLLDIIMPGLDGLRC
jgi:CheY-like chemotaxis protein